MVLPFLDEVLENILDERCIFLLGPGISRAANGKSLNEQLLAYIQTETDLDINLDSDQFLIFPRIKDRILFNTHQKRFYSQFEPEEIHRQLVGIPCHVMISSTPDVLLKKAFSEKNLNKSFGYYDKSKSIDYSNVAYPTKSTPFIYNLFGSVEEPDSTINTYDDLFAFIFSILSESKRLPTILESAIKKANFFVFLGFDFEKWYVKLLLRLFGIHKDSMAIASGGYGIEDMTVKRFYENNFEIVFIDENIPEYVNELYQECVNRGLVRKPSPTPTSSINQIIEKLKEDNLFDALKYLENFALIRNTSQLKGTAILLRGRLKNLEEKIGRGVIQESESTTERNKIRDSILEQLNLLQNI